MTHPCVDFLRTYTNERNPVITFVTMRGGEPGKPMYNVKLSEALPTLQALNKTGSDIFYTVNIADGQGRRFENILAARTFYADYDDGVPEDWSLQPSLIVESSPGKAQAYWVLLEPELPNERWHAAQRGLVWSTGADKNVCDAARVLRLPGFVNWKYPEQPVTKLLRNQQWWYTIEDIERKYPPIAAPAKLAAGCAVPTVEESVKARRYAMWLGAAGEPTASSSGRLPVARNWLFRKAAMGVRDFDLPAAIVADVLCERIPELGYTDALQFAEDAERYATNIRGAAFVRHQSGTLEMK